MHRLKGSPGILVLLFYFQCLWSEAACGGKMRKCHICECDEKKEKVYCDSKNLEVIPNYFNPKLREFRLNNNSIHNVSSFHNIYHELSYLDISNNEIKDLGLQTFKLQRKLETLLISRNMIYFLHPETFIGLTKLKILHLNENMLENITARTFNPLVSLENLELSGNRIFNIDVNAFYGLKDLKSLSLRDNKLEAIPSVSFHYISNLLTLDIGLNPIKQTLGDNSFISLPNLKDLLIDGCALKQLSSAVFHNLSSLLKLRLDDNSLTEIPTASLQHVSFLEELFLSQNLFQEVPARAFKGLKRLRKIVITGCRELKVIRSGSFVDNSDLKQIEVDYNRKLSKIELGSFDGLANIHNVSFRGNLLNSFDSRLLSWDELDYMNISDNPLKCDCQVMWLRNHLKLRNSTDNVVCASPKQLEHRYLSTLSAKEFRCDDNHRRNVIISVSVTIVAIVIVLAMFGFKYRTNIAGVLKDRWGGSRKEPQYQKTNSEEESNILQVAQQSLKMTPVTEL